MASRTASVDTPKGSPTDRTSKTAAVVETSATGHGATRERVAAVLRAEILDGRLAPGVPLRTEAIMERLGVSNSPLREAFVQLAGEGLVDVSRNRGVVVASVTREGAADLLRVGFVLWEAGLRWIIPSLTPDTVAVLKRTDVDFQIGVRSGDVTGAILDGERFEQVLLDSCWSTELVRSIDAMRPRLHRLMRLLASLQILERQGNLQVAIVKAAGTTDVEPSIAALRAVWDEIGRAVELSPRTSL